MGKDLILVLWVFVMPSIKLNLVVIIVVADFKCLLSIYNNM